MNNNITEDYVSFEVAKLFKEKGFKQSTLCYYFEDGEFNKYKIVDAYGYKGDEYTVEYEDLLNNWNDNFLTKKNGDRCFGCNKSKGYFETYSSPTHSLAIKWIRENFGIWIYNEIASMNSFRPKAYELEGDKFGIWEGFKYASPQEATEAALLHTLKNLIP